MKSVSIALSLLLVSASWSCAGSGEPRPHPGDPRPVIIAAGWEGMECSEVCLVDMTLDGPQVTVTWQNSHGSPERHAIGRLTVTGLARLAAIEAALADEHPLTSPPMGCMDCAQRFLTVQRDARQTTYRFDDYSRPPPLTAADRFLRGVIDALVRGERNRNVRSSE